MNYTDIGFNHFLEKPILTTQGNETTVPQYSNLDFETGVESVPLSIVVPAVQPLSTAVTVNDVNELIVDRLGDLTYGSCCGNEVGWSQASAVQYTWYDISDSTMSIINLHGITHDGNGKLGVTKAGKYMADWSGAFEANGANVHLQLAFSVSGKENIHCVNHIETQGANNQHTGAGNAILELKDNDSVNVSIRTTDAGTPNLSVDHLMLRLVQLGG